MSLILKLGGFKSTFGGVFAQPMTIAADNGGGSTITIVNRFHAAAFDTTPSAGTKSARALIQGTLNSAWIGQAAPGTTDFAFAPTRILIGGAGSVSQTQDQMTLSDVAKFSWDGTSDIIVAVDAGNLVVANQSVGAKSDIYHKISSQEASLQTKTGYTTITTAAYHITALEIDGCTVLAPQSNLIVVCDGNSLTSGVPLTTGSYPNQLTFNKRYGARVNNQGLPSATTPQLITRNATGPLFVPGAVAVLWEITNDFYLNNVTPAVALANYWSWCDMVRAQGYKVCAVTVLPRTQAGTPVGFETNRQSVNSSIRSGYLAHADFLADVGADANIGVAGASTNATYYQSDQVHMTFAGYGIVAGIINSALPL